MFSYLSNTFLRGFLRIYFVVAFAVIGLVGSQCCKCAVKLGLVHRRSVALHEMTGWVRGTDLWQGIYKLRRFPGGLWIGMVMVSASVLALVADLATSTLVYRKEVPDRCPFTRGLVVLPNSTWVAPPGTDKPATVASNAQFISQSNDGLTGVYRKANFALDFSAQPDDLLGSWVCKENATLKDRIYVNQTEIEIINDLFENNLQYMTEEWQTADTFGRGNHTFTQLVLWSSSRDADQSSTSFPVKVSVDQSETFTDTRTMSSYDCSVDPASTEYETILSILGTMDPNETLYNWLYNVKSSIYNGENTGPVNNTADMLAQTLNSLTMVQGGDNNLYSTVKVGDNTYGCLISRTYINPFVVLLASLVGFILLSMTFYWILLLFRLSREWINVLPSFIRRSGNITLKPIPDGILSWMLQATRESSFGHQQSTYPNSAMNLDLVPKHEASLLDWKFEVVEDPNQPVYARLVQVPREYSYVEEGNATVLEYGPRVFPTQVMTQTTRLDPQMGSYEKGYSNIPIVSESYHGSY